jgi:hypothetical protein
MKQNVVNGVKALIERCGRNQIMRVLPALAATRCSAIGGNVPRVHVKNF